MCFISSNIISKLNRVVNSQIAEILFLPIFNCPTKCDHVAHLPIRLILVMADGNALGMTYIVRICNNDLGMESTQMFYKDLPTILAELFDCA